MDQLNVKSSTKHHKNYLRQCKNKRKKKQKRQKCMNTQNLEDKLVETKKKIGAFVGHFTQAPIHLVDNEYIKHGYRINYNNSFWEVLKSLFQFHNETVNVWSHLCGMFFFAFLIIYACYDLITYKDMGVIVWKGIPKEDSNEIVHISQYFQDQLSELETDICHSRGKSQEPLSTCLAIYVPENSTKLTLLPKEEEDSQLQEQGTGLDSAVGRIEGLAVSFVSELQNLRHYLEDGELTLQEKLMEWKDHVYDYPQQLKKRIETVRNIMKAQLQMQEEEDFYTNFQFSRLNYLERAMETFQQKMSEFSETALESIDEMDWLEFPKVVQPIADIDSYMNYVSKWPLFIHMASAVLCLGFSAIFHLFFVYSEYASSFLAKLDYGGITILIFGSSVPAIEYVFACSPVHFAKQFFMSIVAISCLSVFIVTLMPVFSRPDFKWLRGSLFIMLGTSVGSPLLYVVFNLQEFVFNFCSQEESMLDGFAVQYICGALIYVLGAALYMTKVPERCKPGTFDICGHSHQLFHFCVLIACFVHYQQNLMLFYRRQQFTCPII